MGVGCEYKWLTQIGYVVLPIKYQTVETAARGIDNCWIPQDLQGRDFSRHTTLDSKMFYSVFSLIWTSLGPLAMF